MDGPEVGPGVLGRGGALGLLAVLTAVWGLHNVVIRAALESMPPLTYAVWRMVGAFAVLAVPLAIRGRLRVPPRSDWPMVATVGWVQMVPGILGLNLALQRVPTGRTAVLIYSMPVWVALLLVTVLRVRLRRSEVVGLLLGLAGLVLLVGPAVRVGGAQQAVGIGLLLFSAITWAITTIRIRRHTWTSTPLELMPWQILIASPPMLVAALVFERGADVRWGWAVIGALAYSGPMATAFGLWASQSITRALGAQVSSIGYLATPLVGLAAGWALLGEELGLPDVLGSLLVIAGVAATTVGTVRLSGRRSRPVGGPDPTSAGPTLPTPTPPTA